MPQAMGEMPAASLPDLSEKAANKPVLPEPETTVHETPPVVMDDLPVEDSGPVLPSPVEAEGSGFDATENPISLPPLNLPADTTDSEPLFPPVERPAQQYPQPETPPVEELPEPAAPETQPIRVSARPDNLPDMKPVRDQEDGSLPRLDVSLGEAPYSATPSAPPGGEAPEKTRLHLPQPGDLSGDEDLHQFSPDDFIIPSVGDEQPGSGVPGSVSVENEKIDEPLSTSEPENVPVFDEPAFPDPESGLTEVNFEPKPAPPAFPEPLKSPDFLQEETSPSAPPEIPEDPFFNETPKSNVEETPKVKKKKDLFASPGDTPEETSGMEPAPRESLQEGSFEKLFAQQSSSPPEVPSNIPPADDSDDTVTIPIPEVPRSSASQELPIPSETVPVSPSRSEADVLDEMFGKPSGESKGMSKSTVVMLCSIGAVVIIATVLVVVIGIAFGGFSVPGPDETDGREDATSMLMAKKEKDEAEENEAEPVEPSIDEAPAVIDPVAIERVEENSEPENPSVPPKPTSTVTLPLDEKKPVLLADPDAPSSLPEEENLDGVVEEAMRAIQGDGAGEPATGEKPEELTFDDALNQFGDSGSATGSEATTSLTDAGSSMIGSSTAPPSGADPATGFPSALPVDGLDSEPKALQAKPMGASGEDGAASNYNPPESFDAPGPEEGSLVRINDLIDAFLRAPDWETRLKYCYNSESLRPAMEEYYKKWPDAGFPQFSQQMFQMELDEDMGGPYWVYLISISDDDQGFPLIIRVEDEKLKVDWEIFAEFNDRHFAKFLKGEMPNPGTYRVVLDRKSDYYGTDRDAFANLDDYYVYEVNAPYGGLNEFFDYAFVKKDSPVAKELDAVLGLNDEPLAVIATLERVNFDHGTKHLIINEYVTEGWFQN